MRYLFPLGLQRVRSHRDSARWAGAAMRGIRRKPGRSSRHPTSCAAHRPAGQPYPETRAMANSMSPVSASPTALTAIARLACRRSPASSVAVPSGKLVAGSRTPLIRCIPQRMPAASRLEKWVWLSRPTRGPRRGDPARSQPRGLCRRTRTWQAGGASR
jgi:hypothetical protein